MVLSNCIFRFSKVWNLQKKFSVKPFQNVHTTSGFLLPQQSSPQKSTLVHLHIYESNVDNHPLCKLWPDPMSYLYLYLLYNPITHWCVNYMLKINSILMTQHKIGRCFINEPNVYKLKFVGKENNQLSVC
jgi:hypothetical protein